MIVEAVVQYHIDNDVPGEVICKACHKQEHPKLNFDDRTINQVYNFT